MQSLGYAGSQLDCGAGSVVGGEVTGGALAMTRVMVEPGRTSAPACLDWEITMPEGIEKWSCR
jgi:hypothetical protein